MPAWLASHCQRDEGAMGVWSEPALEPGAESEKEIWTRTFVTV